MTERRDAIGTVLAARRALVDYYCPFCGMFLTSSDAEPGRRIRARCTSRGCKGKIKEVVTSDPRVTRR
jgi:hypothetical protein